MSEFDVLIIEDEPVVVRAARKVLEPEGITVHAVECGDAARETLRRHAIRAILLDLMLPNVAGLELLEELIREHPDVPVLVTTGYATAKKTVAVLKAGAADFLPKPFDAEELLDLVQRTMRTAAPAGNGVEHSPEDRDLRYLGAHSWARIESDGRATLGATDAFVRSIEGSLTLLLPALGDESVQGKELAYVRSSGSSPHRIWSPLSGLVVERNEDLESDPERLRRDPLMSGWLVKVDPWFLQEELQELTIPRGGRGDKREVT